MMMKYLNDYRLFENLEEIKDVLSDIPDFNEVEIDVNTSSHESEIIIISITPINRSFKMNDSIKLSFIQLKRTFEIDYNFSCCYRTVDDTYYRSF